MKYAAFLILILTVVQNAPAKEYNAVCTTTMITDMLENIASPEVNIQGLMGPGTDPHLYRATPRDSARIRRSDIVFYNGLHLEGRMTEIFESISKKGKKTHAIASAIDPADIIYIEESHGVADPHIWFNIELWASTIDGVTNALCETAPEYSEIFKTRASILKQKYQKLHKWTLSQCNTLPREKRILITSHDAYTYFGACYDFSVVGVQGVSTVTEAGLADIANITDLINEKKVKAIFIESSVSPATIERISKDSNAKVGGELFSDAMGLLGEIEVGPDGSTYDLGTYEGMVKHNIHTIIEALK